MKSPIEVQFTCKECGKEIKVSVEFDDLLRWNLRDYEPISIQKCFPYLSAGERELFLTEICDTCYHKMFFEEE